MTEFIDPYIDPGTRLLRNLVGAKTQAELDVAEADLVHVRLLSLDVHTVAATRDLSEWRAIHHHLLQDTYAWAGELRTVDIRKNVDGAGYFVPVSMLERASAFASGELAEDDGLRDLSREQFIDRLAYHYDQFNYIHPVREGNGRVQRVFWDRVANDAKWQLNWLGVIGKVNDQACMVAAEQRDLEPLIQMFDGIVEPFGT